MQIINERPNAEKKDWYPCLSPISNCIYYTGDNEERLSCQGQEVKRWYKKTELPANWTVLLHAIYRTQFVVIGVDHYSSQINEVACRDINSNWLFTFNIVQFFQLFMSNPTDQKIMTADIVFDKLTSGRVRAYLWRSHENNPNKIDENKLPIYIRSL